MGGQGNQQHGDVRDEAVIADTAQPLDGRILKPYVWSGKALNRSTGGGLP